MIEKVEILLESSMQNEEKVVLIRFRFNQGLINIVRRIPGSVWIRSERAWCIPEKDFDFDSFKQQVSVRAKVNSDKLEIPKASKTMEEGQQELVAGYLELLQQKRYGESTIKSYTSYFKQFQEYFRGHDLREVTVEQINSYLVELICSIEMSTSQQNQRINAIKFYYEKVLRRTRQYYQVERPRKEKKVPTILSKEEVWSLIDRTDNLKHKCILATIYSGGLRRSELMQLRPEDVDTSRKLIKIRSAKGNKDRYTLLSDKLVGLLREYRRIYNPANWLFEGQNGGQYSATSIEKIFKAAVKRAGIRKHVTPHSLRHSFATHLLEQGISLRYIQEILGHCSSRTTEIYTRVASNKLRNIRNPMDEFT